MTNYSHPSGSVPPFGAGNFLPRGMFVNSGFLSAFYVHIDYLQQAKRVDGTQVATAADNSLMHLTTRTSPPYVPDVPLLFFFLNVERSYGLRDSFISIA